MSAALLDAPASAPPPSCPIGPARAEAARGLGRVRRWLWRLADIKKTLLDRARAIEAAQSAEAEAEAAGAVDLILAWSLLARAMRWMRALHARLDDEVEASRIAAPPAKRKAAARLDLGDDVGLGGASNRSVRRPSQASPAVADDCIEGTPTGAVVAQICADLGAAATALGRSIPPQIAAIAEAARALLGEPAEEWTALPIVRPQPRLVAMGAVEVATRDVPVPAPDTG